MAANGSPAPEFETDDERLSYVVRLPAHPLAENGNPSSNPFGLAMYVFICFRCAIHMINSQAIDTLLESHHGFWVVPGRFLAGAHPHKSFEKKPSAPLVALLHARVDCFINLTEEGELPCYQFLLGDSVCHRFPIPDYGVPDSREEMVKILDTIDSALETGRNLYLHCLGGRGRTGTVLGCWLARKGHTGTGALNALRDLWSPSLKGREGRVIPESPTQRDWILNWEAGG